jgi:hypothetical protein
VPVDVRPDAWLAGLGDWRVEVAGAAAGAP